MKNRARFNLKRLVCCLALFAVLIACVSCDNGKENITEPEDTTAAAPAADLLLAGDGSAARVVVPANCSEDVQKLAENVAKRIQKNSGIECEVADDWLMENQNHDPSVVEILIGDTNYPETAQAKEQIEYNEYGIIAVGNKLAVVSYMQDKLTRAVNDLLAILNEQTDSGKRISVKGNYREIVTLVSEASGFPKYSGSSKPEINLFEVSKGAYELFFSEFGNDDYETYTADVQAAGYEACQTNTIDRNVYTVYQKGEKYLHCYWTPTKKQLRVIMESSKNTALPTTAAENQYQKGITSTLFTSLGLNYEQGIMAGMSYLMRLEDGSFIVIDGGYEVATNYDLLYSALREQAPNGKIVIAAWIFTHGHHDHLGAFLGFTEKYANRVTVEQFIYNIPVSSVIATPGEYAEGSARWTKAENAMAKSYPNSKHVHAHAGQVHYIRNAKLTVLYTHELQAPTPLADYNDTSIVLTIEAEGVKTFINADATTAMGRLLPLYYSDATFKSDIMHVAHHGVEDNAYQLHTKIKPTYVIWPLSTGDLSRPEPGVDDFDFIQCISPTWRGGMNSYFFTNGKLKDNVYIANDDVDVFTLSGGKVTVKSYENIAEYLSKNSD
ncbi:MAG: MBL fold metallo-hydrolase [Clostridia bacterium]|nr:MBL fold metallo-hydrolase [Clostridia bacterium]